MNGPRARRGMVPGDAGLAALLERERCALLAGDFSRLPELARQKESHLDRYFDQPERLRSAPELLNALRRNQRLLESALQGLASAQDRFAGHQALLHRMDTYDPSGRRTRIGQGPVGRIHKKI